jgi:hypothetical protein
MGNATSKSDPTLNNNLNHSEMLSNMGNMFKSVNATHETVMPYSNVHNLSTTSMVDVSTIRPMTGGGKINYTRNRYQVYENKLGGGSNGDTVPTAPDATAPDATNPDPTNQAPPEAPEAPEAPPAPEDPSVLNKLTAQVKSLLSNTNPTTGGGAPENEIENIRSLLLNTNNYQNGGNDDAMDINLKAVRDNLLNNQGNAVNFSATSEEQVNMNGGGQEFSATSANPIDLNISMNGGGQSFSATSDDPVDFNMLMKGGAANVNQVYSTTSENQVDYSMPMNGGAEKSKRDKKSKHKYDEDDSPLDDSPIGTLLDSPTDSDSSSNSDSSSDSYSGSDSSDSDSDSEDFGSGMGVEVSELSSAVLTPRYIGKLKRNIDKRQNRSNFLRGDYVLTSNSERTYKVDARPYFSSQSSEYQNEVASEFLNTLRSRNRS